MNIQGNLDGSKFIAEQEVTDNAVQRHGSVAVYPSHLMDFSFFATRSEPERTLSMDPKDTRYWVRNYAGNRYIDTKFLSSGRFMFTPYMREFITGVNAPVCGWHNLHKGDIQSWELIDAEWRVRFCGLCEDACSVKVWCFKKGVDMISTPSKNCSGGLNRFR